MLNATELSPAQITDLIHMKLPEDETRQLLMNLTPEQMTIDILKYLLDAIRETVVPIPALDMDVMDCCGTGGSGLQHFNTSTASAFVLAAGGVKVVKFGNRAITSQSGSFDFLEALGFPAQMSLERVPDMMGACGLVFLYAPQCYPALGAFNEVRRALGMRTVFNFLGPLLNPMQPVYRLLGVSHPGMQQLMAQYLCEHQPSLKRAWLVHGTLKNPELPGQGLDEISAQGLTHVLDIKDHRIKKQLIKAVKKTPVLPKPAHRPAQNAAIFQSLIEGKDKQSAAYRMVCLNAGAGFHIAGLADSMDAGMQLAQTLLKDGAVLHTVDRCRRAYADCAQ